MLFGRLFEFFKDEAELRVLWSAPDTRTTMLDSVWVFRRFRTLFH